MQPFIQPGTLPTMPSLVFEPVGPYVVFCHHQKAPTIAEWDELLALLIARTLADALQGVMVFSQGGGPNTLQRRQLELAMRLHGITTPPPAAIITDAWTARQIATVVSWFIPNLRAFAGQETEAAMTFLGVPDEWRPALIEAGQRLQSRLRDRPSPDRAES
jgi:hypothetical protein